MTGEQRVGDAERDRAAADLGEHFALGRLSAEEHAERLDACWSARTRRDLDVLFHDLPQATPIAPAASAARRPSGWRSRGWRSPTAVPMLPVVVVLILLSVLTHLPFWIAIFLLGCGVMGRRSPALRPHR